MSSIKDLFHANGAPVLKGERHKLDRKSTGYTIYNGEQARRTLRNDLPGLYPDLPRKKYDILYADPPWDYGGKMQFDKTSTHAADMDLSKTIFISSANFKYPTLSACLENGVGVIQALDVDARAARPDGRDRPKDQALPV